MTVLADEVWTGVAARRRTLLVVPTGALEQHGPHLPLDTDTVVASAVARGLARARPLVGLAPALPFGASGEHADFPGTVSIGTAALAELLVELVRHAERHWADVLVVNGHGGNHDALTAAAERARREGRTLGVHHVGRPGMDAHAGRAETSLLLHLAPTRVHVEAAAPGRTEPLQQLLPALRREGVRAVSTNGVLGDPTGASADEGRRLLAALVDDAVAAHDRWWSQMHAAPPRA